VADHSGDLILVFYRRFLTLVEELLDLIWLLVLKIRKPENVLDSNQEKGRELTKSQRMS